MSPIGTNHNVPRTGPEHYLEAERLMQLAAADFYASTKAHLLAAAQVPHATLALAAAQAARPGAESLTLARDWTCCTEGVRGEDR